MTSSRKVGNRFGYSKKDTKENLGGGNNLEKLLNDLIKRGWKPFNVNCAWTNVEVINRLREDNYYIPEHSKIIFKTEEHWHVFDCNIRDLVSKSSGLRQFVCKNKLVKTKDKKVRYRYEDLERTQNYFSWYGYEYRLIESALLKENELEKFLLENIKVS